MKGRLLLVAALVALGGCESERPVATTPPLTTTTAPQPTGEPLRIMPLGDSITQGDSSHDTYRRPLWKTLEGEGYRVDFVGSTRAHHRGSPPHQDFDMDHEGHWGWRVDEILERLTDWLEAHQPDVLLVHLGSNDVFQNQSIEGTVDELRELVERVRHVRPGAVIFLARIIPTDRNSVNARIREFNEKIGGLAASDVVIVDQYTGFDARSQTYDGVHPNPSGEIHLSERWFDALEARLAPTK